MLMFHFTTINRTHTHTHNECISEEERADYLSVLHPAEEKSEWTLEMWERGACILYINKAVWSQSERETNNSISEYPPMDWESLWNTSSSLSRPPAVTLPLCGRHKFSVSSFLPSSSSLFLILLLFFTLSLLPSPCTAPSRHIHWLPFLFSAFIFIGHYMSTMLTPLPLFLMRERARENGSCATFKKT